jgi:uncharacterized membrane protein
MGDNTGRKIPVLASVISLLLGSTSCVVLLGALHVVHLRAFQERLPQSVTYHAIHNAGFACIVMGSVLLWKMRRPASWWLLAGFVLSAVAGTIANMPSRDTSPASRIESWVIFVLLYGSIVIYSWWETKRWERTRPEHTL